MAISPRCSTRIISTDSRRSKEQFDQQFLTQAQQILTPEQLTAFQSFQKAQRDLQIAGMKMAAQMFAPKAQ